MIREIFFIGSMHLSYNWEGDQILRNTMVEKKRYVIGNSAMQVKADIREWISFEDNIVIKEVINNLAEKKKLPRTKRPGDFDRRTMVLWDFVARSITYVHDSEQQKKKDFWLFPPEVCTLRRGDCEDSSFLLASLLLASGISPFCVRIVLGELCDAGEKSVGGHCWPVYKNEMGKWCVLESTLNKIPEKFQEADRLSAEGRQFRYVPYYCFNNYHLWMISPEKASGIKAAQGIAGYFRLRRKKVNMKTIRAFLS